MFGKTNVVHIRRVAARLASAVGVKPRPTLRRDGGFQLVLGQRYLLLIGLLTLAVQLVNTNGNYILTPLSATWRARLRRRNNGGPFRAPDHRSFQADMDLAERPGSPHSILSVSRILKYSCGRSAVHSATLALGSYGLFALLRARS